MLTRNVAKDERDRSSLICIEQEKKIQNQNIKLERLQQLELKVKHLKTSIGAKKAARQEDNEDLTEQVVDSYLKKNFKCKVYMFKEYKEKKHGSWDVEGILENNMKRKKLIKRNWTSKLLTEENVEQAKDFSN